MDARRNEKATDLTVAGAGRRCGIILA